MIKPKSVKAEEKKKAETEEPVVEKKPEKKEPRAPKVRDADSDQN